MKKSWLKFLGFIGFLGLLGLVTSNEGFYGFFGFFGFFGLGTLVSDERLQANINRSARNAFISSIIVSVVAIVCSGLTFNLSILIYAFAGNFALQLVVFVVSLRILDRMWK